MKKITMATAAALLLIGLTACGSSNTNNSATDTTTTQQVPVTTSPHDQFLLDINSLGDSLIANTSDADLWTMATYTCNALDKGATVTYLMNYLANSGTMTSDNARTIGEIVAVSVKDVCPQYLGQVQDFINQYSS